MKRVRFVLLVAGLLAAALGHAQAQRVFVSAKNGNDANTTASCALATPCRMFSAALQVVHEGGEIVVLDSGAYGAVLIDKPVSIIAPDGVYGGITAFSGDGITVTAGSGGVVLRGLSINGIGGVNGIAVTGTADVNIDRCSLGGFSGSGIRVSNAARVRILNTRIERSGHGVYASDGASAVLSNSSVVGGFWGVYLEGSMSADSALVVEGSLITGSDYAVQVLGAYGKATRLAVKDSTVSENRFHGIDAMGDFGPVEATVSNNLVSGSFTGVRTQGGGAALVASGNTITQNTYGMMHSGGTLTSMGDNTVRGNVNDTSGTITSASRI
ncbi:MAG: right-handed parallel beta-helix repeat-containing protein [Betaproteobacteria bacterium]|nr:right-handed parallel beta-helix repeat-containing protein [Betaproteobacteria bacterium]